MAKKLIQVTADDGPEPVQDAPGRPDAAPVDQRAARTDAARLIALWLRGQSFSLGHHPGTHLSSAADLLYRLSRAGFVLWYVGSCEECAANPGLCRVHD